MADACASIDVVGAEARPDQLLDEEGLLVGAAAGGDAAQRIAPICIADAVDLGNGMKVLCPEDMVIHAVLHLLADGGNIKVDGSITANSTKAPPASVTNQRSRKRLQRSIRPTHARVRAITAPIQAPVTFSAASTLDGTRTGKNICKVSMDSDKHAAAKVASQMPGQCRRVRYKAKASKKPKGA